MNTTDTDIPCTIREELCYRPIQAASNTNGLGVEYLDMYTGLPLVQCLLFVLAFALAFMSVVLYNWNTDNRPAATEYAVDTDLLATLWNMGGYGIFAAPTAPIDIIPARPAPEPGCAV